MKIRRDFVTNSSSSSFVVCDIDNKVLSKILQKYEDIFKDCELTVIASDDNVQINVEEGYIDLPDKKEDIMKCVLSLFGCECCCDWCENCEKDDCDECDGFDCKNCTAECDVDCICDYYDDETLCEDKKAMVKEIKENMEEINKNMGDVQITLSESGWQGDSEARYEKENYDEDTLKSIYKTIATEKGCAVKDVTDEDFWEYVSDKVSLEENVFEYNKEKDIVTLFHSFDVE